MNKIITFLSKENITTAENLIRKGIYYLLPIVVIATLLYAVINPIDKRMTFQSGRAETGLNLFILVLFIKPVMVITSKYLPGQSISIGNFLLSIKNLPTTLKQKQLNILAPWRFLLDGVYSIAAYLMKFRRELGIACFWFLFTHGMLQELALIKFKVGFWSALTNITIWTGVIALIALLIGAITSNTYALKKLTTNWKKVQMFAYIALIFACIHTGNIALLIIYIIFKILERRKTGQSPRYYLTRK